MKSVRPYCWFLSLFFSGFALPVLAAPPAGAGDFKSAKDILESLPKPVVQQLNSSGPKAPEAMKQGNEQLKTSVTGKTISLKIRVEEINPAPGATRGTQIKAAADSVRLGSTSFKVHLYAYVKEEGAATLPKAKKGADITVSGLVSRSDITNEKGQLQFHLDLDQAKVE